MYSLIKLFEFDLIANNNIIFFSIDILKMALPDSGAIPKSLRYSEVVPRGLKSDNNFVEFLPTNGSSFAAEQTFRIPIQAYSQFLDTGHSYLKFDVSVFGAAADDCLFDGGASGLISRLRVLSSSNAELERIDDYGAISALMNDINRTTNNTTSSGAIMEGLSDTILPSGHPDMELQRIVAALGAAIPATTTFCLPLHLSGILGPLLHKYLPLPIINNGIVLEITLASPNYALVNQTNNAAFAYLLTNIKYVAALVTPPSDFMAMFKQVTTQSGLTLSSTSFRNYLSQINTNAQNTIKIVDSLKSVKSLFVMMRSAALLNLPQHYSITARAKADCSQFFTRINNIPVPAAAITATVTNASQVYTELMKAMAKLGDSIVGGNISQPSFIVADDIAAVGVAAGASIGAKFALGLDLEAYQNEALISGVSMYSNNTSEIQVVLTADGTVNGGQQVNSILLYDLELNIDNVGNVTVNY